jgi:ADP-ribose pyrophosphatase YjhB (NUDIX family)
LAEETGLSAQIGDVITAIDAIETNSDGTTRFHFVIIAVSCYSAAGEMLAGDDAAEARWVSPAEVCSLDLATGFDVLAVLRAAHLEGV